MAPITDQFVMPPSSDEMKNPEVTGAYPEYESYKSELDTQMLKDYESEVSPAPWIIDTAGATREALEAAQPTKSEVNRFNPEAVYTFTVGAGERITGLRKHYVALQSENFIKTLRDKSTN